jgi:hypothetical protein
MSNVSLYLEALIDFPAPATYQEVHSKAIQMFGRHRVKGDKQSCRQSLERHVLRGMATKDDRGLYLATKKAFDPISDLATKIRVLENQLSAANARIAELEGLKP